MPDTPVVPHAIAVRVARIAAQAPGIRYDAYDPHRAAIEAAAREHGLVLVPSEHIQPRTIEGCTPPPPAVDPGEAVEAVATTLHELLCADLPHQDPSPGDRSRASLLIAALAGRGWTLTPAGQE